MHAVHLHLVIWQTVMNKQNMIYKQGRPTPGAQNIQ